MLFPIELPPGIARSGTEYQVKGRWHECSLVRFYEKTILPVGGWRKKTASAVTGKPRAIITWEANDTTTWAAVGTHSKLYAMSRAGVLSDITPTGFTAGRADAVAEGGYGGGDYGAGDFGTPRPDSSTVQEASMWTLDTFGEKLVGCMAQDGKLYEWTLSTGTPAAAISGAPTAAACFTTAEDILVALGAEGVPRRVKWSDVRDNTQWTPDLTNSAGDDDLKTNGRLLQGLRIRNGNLLITTLDVWSMTFTNNDSVYAFDQVGSGCGGVSRNCGIGLDNQAVWMGDSGLWLYNGFTQSLDCDLWDYVFSDMNPLQKSKVTCELNTAFGEVKWNYPSGSSVEVDRSLVWNFREGHFRVEPYSGAARLSGVDKGVMQYPLACGNDGYVYEHEVGFDYGGAMPYLESGSFEVGEGDVIQDVLQIVPDEKQQGDVTVSFMVKFRPEEAETVNGPFTLLPLTDCRFPARQARIRFDGVRPVAWRIGTFRVEVENTGDQR